MTNELVSALRDWDTYDPNISEEKVLRQAHAVIDAARPLPARIEALEAENARLREALEPFAKDAAKCEGMHPSNTIAHVTTARVRDLRRARRAREGGNNA